LNQVQSSSEKRKKLNGSVKLPPASVIKSFGCNLPDKALLEIYEFKINNRYFIHRDTSAETFLDVIKCEDISDSRKQIKLGCETELATIFLWKMRTFFQCFSFSDIAASGKFVTKGKKNIILTLRNLETSFDRANAKGKDTDINGDISSFWKWFFAKYKKSAVKV
jgi:hypothetical protein